MKDRFRLEKCLVFFCGERAAHLDNGWSSSYQHLFLLFYRLQYRHLGREFSLLSSVRGHCLFVETVSSLMISNH